MSSIITVILIVALCFYVGILYTNPIIISIGYVLLVLLVLSLLELVYRWFCISYHIDIPISIADAGKPVSVMIKIRNKGILPTGKIEVKIENKNVLQRKGQSRWLAIHEVPVGEKKHPMRLIFHGAGCHEVLLAQVKIYSFFGLIYLKRKCKEYSSVLIMPEVYAANVQVTEGVRNFIGDADVYDEYRPGHDSGETFDIRMYREKDKLQSIHWKLSAKMDELMVKENSMPKACAVVLMLQLCPNAGKKQEVEAGAFLDLAASLSYTLMDQNCPHFVTWYSEKKQGITRIRVDDEESFYLFLNAYLQEARPAQTDMREEYRRNYKNEWYLHDILVNEQLEIYKNGNLLTKIDEKKIKDECEKLELLL